MTIKVTRDRSTPMRQNVQIGDYSLVADSSVADGGEDAGPSPHDLYDASLGACKALTLLWYAKRKNIPVEDIGVTIERDQSEERKGVYRLRAVLSVTGAITEAQRDELMRVAEKCPIHKLMTQITTEIETIWG